MEEGIISFEVAPEMKLVAYRVNCFYKELMPEKVASVQHQFQAMEKAREEIKQVTGNNRPLSLQDRPSTPYLVATITV